MKGYDDLYLPSYIQFLQNNKVADKLPRNISNKIKKLIGSKAKNLMTAPCFTVTPTTSVPRLLGLIKKTKFNTWPVTSKGNNLVGIVTLIDILGSFKGRVEEMKKIHERNAKGKREIDLMTQDIRSFWGKTYVFINKTHIKTWKGVFFIAFISGVMAAFIWTVSIKVHENLEAETIPDPVKYIDE